MHIQIWSLFANSKALETSLTFTSKGLGNDVQHGHTTENHTTVKKNVMEIHPQK